MGASKGQVWTRHLAPTAPAVMAFIAISVLPSVRLSIGLSMWFTVLFPSSLNGARSMALFVLGCIARLGWALHVQVWGVLSPSHGVHTGCHVWVACASGLLELAPFGHTPLAQSSPGAWGAHGVRS